MSVLVLLNNKTQTGNTDLASRAKNHLAKKGAGSNSERDRQSKGYEKKR